MKNLFIGLLFVCPFSLVATEADVKINVSKLARHSIMMRGSLESAEAQLYHGSTGFSLHRGSSLTKIERYDSDKITRHLTEDNLIKFLHAGGRLEVTPLSDDSCHIRAFIPGKAGNPFGITLWNGKWTGWVAKQAVRALGYGAAAAATAELTKVIVKTADAGVDGLKDAIVTHVVQGEIEDAIVYDAMAKRLKDGIAAALTAGLETRTALATIPGNGYKKFCGLCTYIGCRGGAGALNDDERRTVAAGFIMAYPKMVEMGQDLSKVMSPSQVAVWNLSKKAMSNKEFTKAMGASIIVNAEVPVSYYARAVEGLATAADIGCQAAGSWWTWLP